MICRLWQGWTTFDSLDDVRGFMGEDYEAAHVPARAQTVLTDFDRRSAHYEVLDRREQPRNPPATQINPYERVGS